MGAPTVVVGAGPAGLATAATLKARGMDIVLLDRAGAVGANWRNRYDGLRLNAVRWLSHLPGHRMPAPTGRRISRDDFIEYLERYAAHHGLSLEPRVEVLRLDPGPDPGHLWRLSTSCGDLDASAVAIATGAFDQPVTPPWAGLARYRGDLCHACEYRNPTPYRGRDVLVVGAGTTGLEIAALLAYGGAGRVYLSMRSDQNIFTRPWRGAPLTPAPMARVVPTSVLDVVVAAMRDGRVTVVPAVADLGVDDVVLSDGQVIRPDSVIVATGYTNGLGKLVGHLGALTETGLPRADAGEFAPTAPGLVFIGFQPNVTGRLLRMPGQARAAARAIERLPAS